MISLNALSSLSDDELMVLYVNGNIEAFEALYLRYESALLRFVRRLLGQPLAAQAEEAFQDAWLRIVDARHSFRRHETRRVWKAWAYTIAYNTAMDRLRASGHEVAIELDDDGDDPLEWLQATLDMTHPSSEDAAYWRAAGEQMLQCLEALPDAQRAAFLLHHEDGATVEDLARRLALPFETIKSRLRYALQKLRGCMHAYLEEMEVRA